MTRLPLALLLFATPVFAQPARLADAIDEVVQPYVEAGDFAGVVAVGREGEAPMVQAYGLASVELSIPHEADGVFMIGSISKQITAVAILLLEEDRALSTDDPVRRHLPDFPHGEVTLHQLMTHTSGVADVYALERFGQSAGQKATFEEVIADLGRQPLAFEPGESYTYSNGGYSVLAAVVEAASGMSYGDFLLQRVFGPLGMAQTAESMPGPAKRGRVSGYVPWGRDALAPAPDVAPAFLRGSGGVWSSARDMVTWAEALHTGRLLNPASYTKLTTDYGRGYGYGVSVFERLDRTTIGHDGRISGYAGDLAHYLEDGVTVVVSGNVESLAYSEIRRHVAAVVFGEEASSYESPAFAERPGGLAALTGLYSFGPGFSVSIREEDGRLLARANEGGSSELVPLEGGAWFSRMLYARVCFGRDDTGAVDRLIWGCSEGAPVGTRTS